MVIGNMRDLIEARLRASARLLRSHTAPAALAVFVVVIVAALALVRAEGSDAFSIHVPDESSQAVQDGASGDEAGTDQVPGEMGDVQRDLEQMVYVHVSGAVAAPGLYALRAGSRVADAVDAAGGLSDDADEGGINLARKLTDGEQVYVPSALDSQIGSESADEGNDGYARGDALASRLVNINRASVDELMVLDGVGRATAEKIVEDRNARGPFSTPEDIMRVSGIGEKKYEAMKSMICV